MLSSKTIDNFLSEVSSSNAAPGGGTAAAYSAAMAAALGVMSCNLTVTNKKYTLVKDEISGIKNNLENLINHFKLSAEKDAEAFEKVIAAFKLPDETDEDKTTRERKIDESLKEAIEVPLGLMKNCREVLDNLEKLESDANQNTLSDVGTAAAVTLAAAQGMYYVILQNYNYAKDKSGLNDYIGEAEQFAKEILNKSNYINDKILRKLNP